VSAELAPLTTLRLGGPARRLVAVDTEEELVAAVRAADAGDEPLLVLSGGSNVVIADAGFAGTVVHVRTRGIRREDGALHVQAGEPWDALVARTVDAGLQGFECLSGIPGSTGATPVQNVGAYGQEVAETVAARPARSRPSPRPPADSRTGAASSSTIRAGSSWRSPSPCASATSPGRCATPSSPGRSAFQ
jgi:UDP-N-acetylmuramate dehydrogenase